MYLSKLSLDPLRASPASRKIQRSFYCLHQAVFGAFDPVARSTGGILFRREPEMQDGKVIVLVQSVLEPNWDRCELSQAFTSPVEPQVKEVEYSLAPGSWLRFRLRANPTRKVKQFDAAGNETRNGKRVSVVLPGTTHWNRAVQSLEERGIANPGSRSIKDWLLDEWLYRSLGGGAAALDFQITDEGNLEDYPVGAGGRLFFHSVRYDGLLQVGDPEVLRERVQEGVGTARGFGFGLLSVGPA